jgi:hypothetical protein
MHWATTESERKPHGPDKLAANRLAAMSVLVALENHNALFVDNVPEEVGAVAAALRWVRMGVLPIPRSVLCEKLTIRPFFELPSDPNLVDVRGRMRRWAAGFAHGVEYMRECATVTVGAHETSATRLAVASSDIVFTVCSPPAALFQAIAPMDTVDA